MKKIDIVVAVILVIIFSAIVCIRIPQYIKYKNRNKLTPEQLVLYDNVIKMHSALRNSNDSLLYNMFNPTFIRDIDFQKFSSAIDFWRKSRKVKQVKIERLIIAGRGGNVTTMVTFNNREQILLHQSWIETTDGWKLMWLGKIMPYTFSYGIPDEKEIQLIKYRILYELIINHRIERIIGDLPVPKTIIVKLPDGIKKSYFRLEDYQIQEYTKDEMKTKKFDISTPFYLEFATIRILGDLVTTFIDIRPLFKNIPKLDRTRGLQLYFIKQDNQWKFDSYGVKW